MDLREALVSLALVLTTGLLPFPAAGKELPAESGKALRSGTAAVSGAMESNIYFGNYWQSVKSEDASDGNKEPVKWRVLANNGGLFVLSDKNLDCVEYNSTAETVSWEECSLRKWLNGEFPDKAFSKEEQGAVLESLVVNEDGAKGSEAGNDTRDKFYILSIYEVIDPDLGFPADWKEKGGTRVALNTEYTRSRHAATDGDGTGTWWLRTPGDAKNAANVFNAGNVFVRGSNVSNFDLAVRPAMNIDSSKVLFASAAEGGKISGKPGADAMKKVASYTGSDWKLTIKDEIRPVFEASLSGSNTILKDGAVKLKYSGAVTGENEFVSAVIEDMEGNILYYGNIAGNTAAGEAAFYVPADLAPGNYRIKVFSEQCNGDFKTDLAGNIVTLDITVSNYTTADRNLCIGAGAAIAAACVAVVLVIMKKKSA